MEGIGALVVHALWLLLPAYLANMAPVLVGGGPPIDGGRVWSDGRRVLGDGKTWRGLLLAPPLAAGAYAALDALARRGLLPFEPFSADVAWTFVFALAMGLGALLGDAAESFAKRRMGKARGERWLGFDQLDFVLGAWFVGAVAGTLLAPAYGANWFLVTFTWSVLLLQLVLTPALHLTVNVVGYKLGLKEVPW